MMRLKIIHIKYPMFRFRNWVLPTKITGNTNQMAKHKKPMNLNFKASLKETK